jgi:type VI secretion system protein ImpB
MAKSESTQQKLKRVRPPRVRITYDVETNGAQEQKELPYVQGVIGDFTGHNKDQPRLKDRKFVTIDRDNRDDVMKKLAPKLQVRVPNKLDKNSDSMLAVELNFGQLDDFEPANVAKQVKPLKALLDERTRLSDLANKMNGNDRFDEMLNELVTDEKKLRAISEEHAANKTNGDEE